MKQMTRSISHQLFVLSAMLFLFLATGTPVSHAEEKTGVSKAVFYVA